MSYLQIHMANGVLARTLELSTQRISGFPSYETEYTGRNSVRTILYEDSTGVYLSRDKNFRLTNVRGFLIFSADLSLEPYIPEGVRYSWPDIWANQLNSNNRKQDLIWPYENWQDAWAYIARRRFLVTLFADFGQIPDWPRGAWMSQSEDRLVWSERPSSFYLIDENGSYGFQAENSEYVSSIDDGRMVLRKPLQELLRLVPSQIEGSTYNIYKLGSQEPLTWDYWCLFRIIVCFRKEPWAMRVGGPNPAIRIKLVVIDPRLTDMDLYRLGPYADLKTSSQVFYPPPQLQNIRENLPTGNPCDLTGGWDGTNLACSTYRIPYTPEVGLQQCTTLDDFSNDQHCTLWAKEYNPKIVEERLKFLCQTQLIDGPNNDICKCYFPDDLYFDRIKENVSERVASGIKATNILQCASGLCTQDGSFSADIFYRGSRRCDLCIQVMSTNINAEQIRGNVTLQQLCTQVDASFTWQNLISDLRRYGTYQIGQPQQTNIFKHVIISSDGLSIKLLLGSTLAKKIIQESQLLKFIPKDKDGNIIITQAIWNRSPTTYSNEILSFFLNARE